MECDGWLARVRKMVDDARLGIRLRGDNTRAVAACNNSFHIRNQNLGCSAQIFRVDLVPVAIPFRLKVDAACINFRKVAAVAGHQPSS